MIVINLFGGAGCGKSTIRAGLFHLLKTHGVVCEEAPEWIKQKVYEGNKYPFQDQLYTFAKQARILKQLDGKVDIAVCDSPLLLSMIYGKNNSEAFNQVIREEFNKYRNINIFVQRCCPYQQTGRYRGEEAARKKDEEIRRLLINVPHIGVRGDNDAPRHIFEHLRLEDLIEV